MTFSRIQILFVLLLFTGISNHVLIIPHLLNIARRDAWFCILIAYAILLIWAILYTIIFAKNKEHLPFPIWLEKKIGKIPTQIILLLFIIFFLVIGFITFYDLIVTVKIYFLPTTPTGYLLIPFLLLCIWTASTGFRTIIYTSTVLLPIVWVLGHFVALTTMEEKDYSYLFPLFADKDASFLGGIVIVLAGSVDLLVLFLLQQHFKKPISYLYLFILISLLKGLTLGPTMGCITAFGPDIAADLRFPAFEQWRLVMIGEHISHADALAVFQLLCGAIIRISLCFYVIPLAFNVQSAKRKKIIIIITAIIYAIVMWLHISDILMQTILRNYIYPSITIFGIVITIVLFTISFLPKREVPMTYEKS